MSTQSNDNNEGDATMRPSTQRKRGTIANKKRAEAHRQKKGLETMQEFHKQLEDKLYMGFRLQEATLATMPKPAAVARNIPVTTRGIGFAVNNVYRRMSQEFQQQFTRFITPMQLYRCSLLQAHYQMHKAVVSHRYYSMPLGVGFFRPTFSYDLQELVRTETEQFGLVAGVINSIGNFSAGDTDYNAWLTTGRNYRYLNINIESLQDTTRFLAANANHARRQTFHNLNPIPGAEWDNNHRLLNPEDIIPPGYVDDLPAIREDFEALRAALGFVRRKRSELVSSLNFDGKGSPCQLVCSEVMPAGIINGRDPYSEAHTHWTLENVSPTTFWMGVITRVGEVPPAIQDWSRVRLAENARTATEASWLNAVRLVNG